MRELSLNILDIASNSIRANASTICIDILAKDNILTIKIVDDGCGMSSDMLKTVVDPYSTTRTTRKVGLGVPLFKMASEQSGGKFSIVSAINKGTTVCATFVIDNIDRPPIGDIASTFVDLIYQEPKIRFVLNFFVNGVGFCVDTNQIKQILQGVDIVEYEVIKYIKDMINDNIVEIKGDIL